MAIIFIPRTCYRGTVSEFDAAASLLSTSFSFPARYKKNDSEVFKFKSCAILAGFELRAADRNSLILLSFLFFFLSLSPRVVACSDSCSLTKFFVSNRSYLRLTRLLIFKNFSERKKCLLVEKAMMKTLTREKKNLNTRLTKESVKPNFHLSQPTAPPLHPPHSFDRNKFTSRQHADNLFYHVTPSVSIKRGSHGIVPHLSKPAHYPRANRRHRRLMDLTDCQTEGIKIPNKRICNPLSPLIPARHLH